MMRVALLCLLLSLTQGTIVSISTPSGLAKPFDLDLNLVDPSTGQFKKVVDLPSEVKLPFSGALRTDNTFVYCNLAPEFGGYLTAVDLSTGKIQDGRIFPSVVFNVVGFDEVTKQTFVFAKNKSTNRFPLFELLPDQTLRKVMELPFGRDFPAEVSLSAYSSSKHIFFLGAPTPGNAYSTHIVSVSTVGAGKLLYNVSVGLGLVSLMYDDTFGVLYAWGSSDSASYDLVSLDFATGTILKIFFQVSSLGLDAACINEEGTVIYSSLFDSDSKNFVLHSLELSSGNATQVPTGRYTVAMAFQ